MFSPFDLVTLQPIPEWQLKHPYLETLVIVHLNIPYSSLIVNNSASGLAHLHYYPQLEKCDVMCDKSLCPTDVDVIICFQKCHSGIDYSVTSPEENIIGYTSQFLACERKTL